MIPQNRFLLAKEKALESLEEDLTDNKVDQKIIALIHILNESFEYYTSSSCAGRIVLLELPCLGHKIKARFLGKWHRRIKTQELRDAFKKAKNGPLWLLAQAPIIHVGANSLESGDSLLKKSIECGFKNSGFKSIHPKVIIEIASTERLDTPIGIHGKLFCSDQHLQLLIDIANEVLQRSKRKLLKLEHKLKEILQQH